MLRIEEVATLDDGRAAQHVLKKRRFPPILVSFGQMD
jgi:hypothetical protein